MILSGNNMYISKISGISATSSLSDIDNGHDRVLPAMRKRKPLKGLISRIPHIVFIASIATVSLSSMTACSSESGVNVPDSEDPRLCLRLVMPQSTRAGDKTETALEAENAVNDITVFFFNDSNGIDGTPSTPFISTVYIDRGFSYNGNIFTVDVPMPDNYVYQAGDRIAVTVNMGDLSDLSTLGDLQTHVPEATWNATASGSPSGCTGFTMASAYRDDGLLYMVSSYDGSTNSKTYTASVTVERTAARIDLGYNAEQEKDGYIEYQSTSKKDGQINGQVYLYGLSPVNSMQCPSYTLKRVSNGLSDDYSCFGQWHYGGFPEDESGLVASYVIEPHTSSKTVSATVPSEWYGSTSAAILSGSGWDDDLNIGTLLSDEKIRFTSDGYQAVVVAYTNENTQHHTCHNKNWLTGLLLRAVYVPAKVYDYAGGLLSQNTGYRAHDTFWSYRITDSGTPDDQRVLYFSSREDALRYSSDHSSDGAVISEYPSGRCFYHLWIRHIVEDGTVTADSPMKYGIVRNHTYRVVFSFHRAGDPTPEINNPQNADAAIYVRPWNIFRHEQIII